LRIVIGIDPGINGGICIINNKNVMAKKMPETPMELYQFLKKFSNFDIICVLETVGGMPKQGGKSMFTFGKMYGHLEMALLALKIKTYPVTPQKWQKDFQLGTTKSGGNLTTTQWKKILRSKAQQLFPSVKITNSTSDAILIAEYGVRNYLKD